MKKLITLSFLPAFQHLGILLLRVWYGAGIFYIHGWNKLAHFGGTVTAFGGMGIPSFLAVLAILAESFGGLFLAVGLATRWAALVLATNMAVAFIHVHHLNLNETDPMSGEKAFLFLGAYVALIFTGGGRYSVDAQISKQAKH